MTAAPAGERSERKRVPVPETVTRSGVGLAAVAVVAFAVRALHLVQMQASPFLAHRVGDAVGYHEWALRIAGGDWLGDEVFYQAPLYPYFLALVYQVVGSEPTAVRWLQIGVGSLSCALLAWAGTRLFSARVGWIAGLLLAVYAPAVFADALLQKSVLDLFFVCLLLCVLAVAMRAASPRNLFAAGAVSALLFLTRENGIILALPILAWTLLPGRGGRVRRARLAGAYALGIAVVLGPVTVRNAWVGGVFAPTTSQLGSNLYIGNHAGATGMYQPLVAERGTQRFERSDATRLAERAVGHALSATGVSRYWIERVLAFVRSEPAAWGALQIRKLGLLINATEVPDTEDQYVFARWSLPLRWGARVTHFGVIVPLAVAGAFCAWPRRRELALLYALPVAYAAATAAFYVMARYRLPLVPFLLLFTACACVEAPSHLRTAKPYRRATLLSVVALVVIACNVPLVPDTPRLAQSHFNLGARLHELGRLEAAAEHYRLSIASGPFPQAHTHLGVILQQQQRPDDAIAEFRTALRIDPSSASAHYWLGKTLQERGRVKQALLHLRRATELRPSSAPAYIDLGYALLEVGERDEAIRAFEAALALEPERAAALGTLLPVLRAQRGPKRGATD